MQNYNKIEVNLFQLFCKTFDTLYFIIVLLLVAQRVVAKVLVVSGWKGGDYRWKPEIWPRPKTQCALPDYPLRVVGAVGFMTALGPVVCDGECLVYQQHQWMPFSNLIYDRRYASAIEVSSHQALIIGGIDENVNFLKTTERISSSGSEERNNFPVSINSHCSFKYNATHAMVTAGRQDGRSVSANTWYVDLNTTRVTPGPTMKTKREGHGCATFQYGTKSYGIVAGGYNYVRLDSTEMIELGQESPTWTEGMQNKSKNSLSPDRVFFLLIFRSKITQKIRRFDFGEDK